MLCRLANLLKMYFGSKEHFLSADALKALSSGLTCSKCTLTLPNREIWQDHMSVDICCSNKSSVLSFSLMPGHKRKKWPDTVASPLAALIAPTLKEHMWNELTEVVNTFSTIPL
jgi:hypothetical protein